MAAVKPFVHEGGHDPVRTADQEQNFAPKRSWSSFVQGKIMDSPRMSRRAVPDRRNFSLVGETVVDRQLVPFATAPKRFISGSPCNRGLLLLPIPV
jgi:hypothetical protein